MPVATGSVAKLDPDHVERWKIGIGGSARDLGGADRVGGYPEHPDPDPDGHKERTQLNLC